MSVWLCRFALQAKIVNPMTNNKFTESGAIPIASRGELWRQRVQFTWKGVQRVYPALAFLSGFLLDTFTIGREIQITNLYSLVGYWCVAFFLQVSLARNLWVSVRKWVLLALQFCFGALFSALVVIYFKSAGSINALLFVALLTGLLLANEFWQNRYETPWLSWSLFTFAGTLFFNLVIPFVFHSVRPEWFLVAVFFALLTSFALWKWSAKPRLGMLGPLLVLLLCLGLHFASLLPPVPLVLRGHLVCRNMERNAGQITCLQEKQPLLVRLGLEIPTYHRAAGDRLYGISSVFAPSRVKVEIEHRWFYRGGEGWEQVDVIPFKMEGGRRDGWRIHSNKRSLAPGEWKLEVAVAQGAVMGFVRFNISSDPEGPDMRFVRRVVP